MKLPRSTILRTMLVGMIVLVVAALGVSVALADHIAPVSMDASTYGCSLYFTVEWGIDACATSVYAYIDGYSNGKYAGSMEVYVPGFPPDNSSYSGKAWIGHPSWDSIDFHVNDAAVTGISRNCTDEEPQNWWFSVEDLGSTSQYSNNGSQACGVFDVQGWRAKIVDLADYPNCSGEVTVMCLDGDGNWTNSNIHNFAQDGTVVTFMSSQHGTCAFFEQ